MRFWSHFDFLATIERRGGKGGGGERRDREDEGEEGEGGAVRLRNQQEWG